MRRILQSPRSLIQPVHCNLEYPIKSNPNIEHQLTNCLCGIMSTHTEFRTGMFRITDECM